MGFYTVRLPIAGSVTVEVEANTEAEAIEMAISSGWTTDDIDECDAYEYLVRGNVVYAPVWKASAELILEDE